MLAMVPFTALMRSAVSSEGMIAKGTGVVADRVGRCDRQAPCIGCDADMMHS